MSDPHAWLFLAVVGGFCLTESYVAATTPLWTYWGFVALNVWGAYNLLKRRKENDAHRQRMDDSG